MKPIVAYLLLLLMMTLLLPGCSHTADYRLCGTFMPYRFTPTDDLLTPPAGYTLRYVSHLGRHGSRYPVSADELQYLITVLTDAEQRAFLSNTGRELLVQLQQILRACEGHWGALSPLGIAQQQQIASRLLTRFPTLPSGRINVLTDKAERCHSSMKAFLQVIGDNNVQITILPDGNPVLDFFKLNAAYRAYQEQGPWRSLYYAFADSVLSNDRPIRALFTGAYAYSLKHRVKFLHALFAVNAILPDTDLPYTLQGYFTGEALYALWSVENVRQYLEKGPSPVSRGLTTTISFPLLRTFLADADRALAAQGRITADLRFAHAETIIPLAALMQLAGVDTALTNLPEVNRTWLDFQVAPMAANVQWLFYGNDAGDWLLLPLLNERPAQIPVASDVAPFYPWPAVRALYEAKLDALGIDSTLSLTNQVRTYAIIP